MGSLGSALAGVGSSIMGMPGMGTPNISGLPGAPNASIGVNPMDMILGNGGFAGPIQDPSTGGPLPPVLQTGPAADAMNEIAEGTVRGWKPKKQGWFGAIADAFLQSRGMQPAFRKNVEQRNLKAAMEGFTQDPLEAIRRLAQIDGMQGKAWDLYNQVVDNQRAQGTLDRQNRMIDMRNDDYVYNMVGGMMSVATPENWKAMRDLAIKRGQDRGTDVSHIIPEEYDGSSVDFIRYGQIKPKDYEVIKERRENNQARVGLAEDRLEETIRNNNLRNEDRDDSEEIRKNRPTSGASIKSRLGGRAYRDPNGTLVEFNKEGTNIKATTSDGRIELFRLGVDGKPVKVKSYANEAEYKAALAAAKGN